MGDRTQPRGVLCVVSGPSGSGKTTICRAVSEQGEAVYAISATTRAPRGTEENGKDYFFFTREEFESRVKSEAFLEYAEVHGNYYGTLKSEVLGHLEAGTDVLMDIDVQGAAQVRACQDPAIRESLVDVFVLPPSMDELKARLSGRGTETEEQKALRLGNATEEMAHWPEYGYTIVSRTREEDLEAFLHILKAERQRSHRLVLPPESGLPVLKKHPFKP